MTVDEKGLDEIVKAAWREVRGPLVGASDGQTYVVPTLTNDLMRDICRAAITAYESARSAEPVAWRYELACAVRHHPDGSKTGENWKWHLTDFAPNVPDWGIRNLTLLYAHPTPEPSDA